MEHLFRVIVLHPGDLPEGFEVTVLDSAVTDGAENRRAARRAAAAFLGSGRAVRHPGELWQAGVAVAVHDLLQGGPRPIADVIGVVAEVCGRPLGAVAGAPSLTASQRRVADTLVSVELVGHADDVDVAMLAAAAQGYDVLCRAAAGQDPVGLRPLAMPRIGVAESPRGRVAS